MIRLDVRSRVNLPVKLLKTNGEKSAVEKETSFSVLSLNGALIDYKEKIPEQKVVGLRYQLPKYGEFDVLGKVVSNDEKGTAVQFYNLNRDAKIKLWDYIKENIVEEKACPYCRGENIQKASTCSICGWSLNFDSPDYLIQHEKESFIKKLSTRVKTLSIEDISRILNFIDVEILGMDVPQTDISSLTTLRDVRSVIEKKKLAEALKFCNNNISKTAKILGISRPSVYSFRKKYGV